MKVMRGRKTNTVSSGEQHRLPLLMQVDVTCVAAATLKRSGNAAKLIYINSRPTWRSIMRLFHHNYCEYLLRSRRFVTPRHDD